MEKAGGLQVVGKWLERDKSYSQFYSRTFTLQSRRENLYMLLSGKQGKKKSYLNTLQKLKGGGELLVYLDYSKKTRRPGLKQLVASSLFRY